MTERNWGYARWLTGAMAMGSALSVTGPLATAQSDMNPAVSKSYASPSCAAEGKVRFICGLPKSEDLVLVPGTDWVAASSLEGGIYLIDTKTKNPVRIFPTPDSRFRVDHGRYPDCKLPPDGEELAHFNTLGINVTPISRSRHRIFVTRYPGPSRIDVLELDVRGQPKMTWTGCVTPQEGVFANSIVGLPDGGFLLTSFYKTGPGIKAARASAEAGEITGDIWSWKPRAGWKKVPDTQSSGTNGLATSEDGKTAYVSQWGSRTFMRVTLGAQKPRRDIIQLGFRPDNVHWAPDGKLLLAGHTDTEGFVAKIDPMTLVVTPLIYRKDNKDFAHMTGAVEIGDEIWVGSTRSDRIAVYPRSAQSQEPKP